MYTIEQYNKFLQCLEVCAENNWFINNKVSCGCNLYLDCNNYDYIWHIVDQYQLSELRCSVVAPGGCYQQFKYNKKYYYNSLKPIFLNFCQNALIHKCKLYLDCNHIPMCYFTETEKKLLYATCNNLYDDFCEPTIDFTPDLRASSCFGAYDLIDINQFHTLSELRRFLFINKVIPRV